MHEPRGPHRPELVPVALSPLDPTPGHFGMADTTNRTIIAGHTHELERRNLSPETIAIRRRCGERFAEWLHPRTLLDATADDVEVFLDSRDLSPRTRYAWCSNLHRIFDWAIRHDLAVSDPTDRVIRPRIDRLLPRPISDHDLGTALRQSGSATMSAWLLLGALAGLRCAEIAGLGRSDVLEHEMLLRVIGKGRRERVVPMHSAILAGLRRCGLPQAGPIFIRPNGSPYTPPMVSREISQYLDSVGVAATAHQLRHWFGTRTYSECRDLRTVQELLGHASPATTAIYTAASPEHARYAIDALAAPA